MKTNNKKNNPFIKAVAAGFITLNLLFGYVACSNGSSNEAPPPIVNPGNELEEALRELNRAIADAYAVDNNLYTSASYAAVSTALLMPQDTLEQVRAKAAAIRTAIDDLEEKSITPSEITVNGVSLSETITYTGQDLNIANTGPKVSGNLTLKLDGSTPLNFETVLLPTLEKLQDCTTGKVFITTGGLPCELNMNTIKTLSTGKYGNIDVKSTPKTLLGGYNVDYKEVTIAPNTNVEIEGNMSVNTMEIKKGAGATLTIKGNDISNLEFTNEGLGVNSEELIKAFNTFGINSSTPYDNLPKLNDIGILDSEVNNPITSGLLDYLRPYYTTNADQNVNRTGKLYNFGVSGNISPDVGAGLNGLVAGQKVYNGNTLNEAAITKITIDDALFWGAYSDISNVIVEGAKTIDITQSIRMYGLVIWNDDMSKLINPGTAHGLAIYRDGASHGMQSDGIIRPYKYLKSTGTQFGQGKAGSSSIIDLRFLDPSGNITKLSNSFNNGWFDSATSVEIRSKLESPMWFSSPFVNDTHTFLTDEELLEIFSVGGVVPDPTPITRAAMANNLNPSIIERIKGLLERQRV